jgi:hypothetical protein
VKTSLIHVYERWWVCILAALIWFCGCGNERPLGDTKQGKAVATESNLFTSGFASRIKVPLSEGQSEVLRSAVNQLTKGGQKGDWLSPLPCGVFRIDGREYSWYKQFFFIEKKRGEIFITNELFTALTDRMLSFGKEPYDLNSNEWGQVLTVLDREKPSPAQPRKP